MMSRARHAAALGLALTALGACESTALSLGDPNEVNSSFVPSFIQGDEFDIFVAVTVESENDSEEGSVGERAVVEYDFGPGLFLRSWSFDTNFRFTMQIQRFADAEPGERELTLRIHNHFGEFLVRGAFTVLR